MFFVFFTLYIYVCAVSERKSGCKITNKMLNLQENHRKLRFFSQIFCWFGKK